MEPNKDVIQPIVDELSSFIEKDTFTFVYPYAEIYPPDKIYGLLIELHNMVIIENVKIEAAKGYDDIYRCHTNGYYSHKGEDKNYTICTDSDYINIEF